MSKWLDRIVGQGKEDPTQLLANPENFRVHPKEQQDALKKALDRVGFVQQIVVNKTTGHVIDGHLRVELALSEGQDQVPVVYVEVSQEEERLILATLDPIAAMAGIDKEKLEQLVSGLATDEDVVLARMVNKMFEAGKDGFTDPDEVPEPRATDIVFGDVYQMGAHLLTCGDSTELGSVAKVMRGDQAVLVHADPPYGMGKEKEGIANDNLKGADLDAFQMAWWAACIQSLTDHASAYVWGNAPDLWRLWWGSLASDAVVMRNEIVWKKPAAQGQLSEKFMQYPTATERCLFFMRGGKVTNESGHYFDNTHDKQTDVWEFMSEITDIWEFPSPKGAGRFGHATPKPVAMVERAFRSSSPSGGIVYVPFGGTGPEVIAGERLSRSCRVVEMNPQYCQVIIDRWEAFTHQEAVKL